MGSSRFGMGPLCPGGELKTFQRFLRVVMVLRWNTAVNSADPGAITYFAAIHVQPIAITRVAASRMRSSEGRGPRRLPKDGVSGRNAAGAMHVGSICVEENYAPTRSLGRGTNRDAPP